jgi:DNA-directed RNA polymerase specialized sigma54-like protein
LNGRGIDIKRRTVAKYRNELGIGTQSARKLMAVS